MPKGNPGVPKSAAHRASIAASVKMYHDGSRAKLQNLLDGYIPAGEQVEYLASAMALMMEAVAGRVTLLRAALAEAHTELKARGGAIRSLDAIALAQAKSIGLLPANAVRDEFERRRIEHGTPDLRRPANHRRNGDGGVKWIGGQFLTVDEGPGRQYVDGNFVPVDLDESLAAAERDHTEAQRRAAAALAALDQVRAQVARYDEQQQKAADDPED